MERTSPHTKGLRAQPMAPLPMVLHTDPRSADSPDYEKGL